MTTVLAASHVHSEWSYDAKWPLPRLAASFAERGYGVLLLTDHDNEFSEARCREHRAACAAASSDRILIVPGIEYSDPDNVVHTLVWGDVPFAGAARPTAEVLDRVHDAGGLAVLAHPWRKEAWRRVSPAWFPRLSGIEVWNRKYDGWRSGTEAAKLLAQSGLQPFVGHDFHVPRQFFPMGMEMQLDGAVTEQAVLTALRNRAARAVSFGVSVERFETGPLRAATSLAEGLRRLAAGGLRAASARSK